MTSYFAASCPSCGYEMDAHSAVGHHDAVPGTGDWSVCLACGQLLIYRRVFGKLSLRLPTDVELQEALQDPVVVATMLAQRDARSKNENDWPRGPKEER